MAGEVAAAAFLKQPEGSRGGLSLPADTRSPGTALWTAVPRVGAAAWPRGAGPCRPGSRTGLCAAFRVPPESGSELFRPNHTLNTGSKCSVTNCSAAVFVLPDSRAPAELKPESRRPRPAPLVAQGELLPRVTPRRRTCRPGRNKGCWGHCTPKAKACRHSPL